MSLPAEDQTPDYGTPEWQKRTSAEIIEIKPKGGNDFVHVAKRFTYLERLERDGVITHQMLSGSQKFQHHFREASLERYASINLFRVTGGIGEGAQERLIFHKREVTKALRAVGDGMAASLIWDVCGLENPISHWTARKRIDGVGINDHVAKGMLIAGLEILARHFGY